MSRILGGGRVLGNGGSLSPAVAHPQRSSSLLSPSASSISLPSQVSTSQISGEDHDNDFGSKIVLDHGVPLSGEAPTSKLVCPICNEDMLTLLQLNRHLDDNHQNLEAVEQDEVKTWFKKQMVKAKKFQPLAVLNQKLKGLDVFEPNEGPTAPFQGPSTAPVEASVFDPDDVVTKVHWQRTTSHDRCSEPMCGNSLGAMNGSVNCRKCGKLFCEEHTMYQMKLSRSAQHEPVRGYWCRVCETCYKSREGYNDHNGFTRDHSQDFFSTRRKTVDARFLEISRLEKRLTKLTQLLSSQIAEQGTGNGSLLWPLSGQRNQRKALEQSVVTWEDDASVVVCPFCQQEFSTYVNRRHHCRLCGRVVCGDPRTGCSTEVGLDVASSVDPVSEKAIENIHVQVRMCKECNHTLFSRRDYAEELAKKPPDLRSYETLIQFERGIRALLPRFQSLLVVLQDAEKPPTSNQLVEASKIRRRLMDSFTQYDIAARRIRDLPTASAAQGKLQKAVYQQATTFLHLHMLPLKTLPKILKQTPSSSSSSLSNGGGGGGGINGPHAPRPNGNHTSSSSTTTNHLHHHQPLGTGSSSSSTNTLISTLEAEERQLREKLIVLEEQRFMVEDMLATARKRRKFDEVASLTQNLADLKAEIDIVNASLGSLDFGAAYEGVGVAGAAMVYEGVGVAGAATVYEGGGGGGGASVVDTGSTSTLVPSLSTIDGVAGDQGRSSSTTNSSLATPEPNGHGSDSRGEGGGGVGGGEGRRGNPGRLGSFFGGKSS